HDFVEHVVVELPEVRPRAGKFQRDEIGDQDNAIRPFGTDKGVDVRVVRERILTNERRLAMARRAQWDEERAGGHERQRQTSKLSHAAPPSRSTEAIGYRMCAGSGGRG